MRNKKKRKVDVHANDIGDLELDYGDEQTMNETGEYSTPTDHPIKSKMATGFGANSNAKKPKSLRQPPNKTAEPKIFEVTMSDNLKDLGRTNKLGGKLTNSGGTHETMGNGYDGSAPEPNIDGLKKVGKDKLGQKLKNSGGMHEKADGGVQENMDIINASLDDGVDIVKLFEQYAASREVVTLDEFNEICEANGSTSRIGQAGFLQLLNNSNQIFVENSDPRGQPFYTAQPAGITLQPGMPEFGGQEDEFGDGTLDGIGEFDAEVPTMDELGNDVPSMDQLDGEIGQFDDGQMGFDDGYVDDGFEDEEMGMGMPGQGGQFQDDPYNYNAAEPVDDMEFTLDDLPGAGDDYDDVAHDWDNPSPRSLDQSHNPARRHTSMRGPYENKAKGKKTLSESSVEKIKQAGNPSANTKEMGKEWPRKLKNTGGTTAAQDSTHGDANDGFTKEIRPSKLGQKLKNTGGHLEKADGGIASATLKGDSGAMYENVQSLSRYLKPKILEAAKGLQPGYKTMFVAIANNKSGKSRQSFAEALLDVEELAQVFGESHVTLGVSFLNGDKAFKQIQLPVRDIKPRGPIVAEGKAIFRHKVVAKLFANRALAEGKTCKLSSHNWGTSVSTNLKWADAKNCFATIAESIVKKIVNEGSRFQSNDWSGVPGSIVIHYFVHDGKLYEDTPRLGSGPTERASGIAQAVPALYQKVVEVFKTLGNESLCELEVEFNSSGYHAPMSMYGGADNLGWPEEGEDIREATRVMLNTDNDVIDLTQLKDEIGKHYREFINAADVEHDDSGPEYDPYHDRD